MATGYRQHSNLLTLSKLFSLLALLIVAACAAPSWAVDVGNADDLQNAVDGGGTVDLSQDISLDSTLTIKSSVTVNGNGHTLSLKTGGTGSVIKIPDSTNGTVNITIKNLRITSGKATEYGGGINIQGGTVSVDNCVLDSNSAGLSGGGMCVGNKASAIVTRCTFTNNTASGSGDSDYQYRGGGLRVENEGSVKVTNCTFTKNKADKGGGGLYVNSGGNATVNYCTFVENTGAQGSELYKAVEAPLTVTNSILCNTGTALTYDDKTQGALTLPTNCLTLTATTLTEDPHAKDATCKVTHTVFRKHAELYEAVNKGNDTSVTVDQLGNTVTDKHDIGAVEIAAHVHSFTYSAKDNVIKAKCSVPGCDLMTIEPELTITATSCAYNGKAVIVITGKNAILNSDIPDEALTIVYKQGATELKSAPVNAGEYTANITLKDVMLTDSHSKGNVTASVSFTITKRSATVTANPQTVKQGESIATGTNQVTTSDLLSGHKLSKVMLTASSTASATTSGTITPSGATITDSSGNDVTANYAIEYKTGTLTVESSSSGSGDSDDVTTPVKITTKTLPDATLDKAYSATLSATGDDPISWKIVSGALPAGLTLNENTGTISGTPTEPGTATLTLRASNAAGTAESRFVFSVLDIRPSTWKVTYSPKKLKDRSERRKFTVTFREKQGTNVRYTMDKSNIEKSKAYVVYKGQVLVNKDEAGAGYVKSKFERKKNAGGKTTLTFKEVIAENDYGSSTVKWRVIVPKSNGSIKGKKLGVVQDDKQDDDLDDEDEDGSMDEDGGITAVIGSASGEYVYPSLDGLLSALAGQLDKVVILEFRGAAGLVSLKTADLAKLTNLSDIEINECPDLTEVDLSGNAALATLSVFSCPALSSLNVRNCAELVSLEALECANLKKLDIDGCSELQCLSLNGASSLETLDLGGAAGGSVALAAGFSRFSKLSLLTVNDCGKLSTLNVAGCPALEDLDAAYTDVRKLDLSQNTALTDVFLNKTKVEDLDLSQCPKLKSLSLVGAEDLTALQLHPDAKLEEFDLDGSQVTALSFRGNTEITELDLSGNTGLTSLDLSGCSSLKTLNLTGDAVLTSLDLTGCLALETLEANGCERLAALDLNDCQALRTASLESIALKGLDLSLHEALVSLDLAGCGVLVSLDVSRCALRELKVDGCAKLASLNCAKNALGQLELTGLKRLTAASADCDGQVIGGVSMNVTLSLSPYAGEELTRVSAVKGCDADGAPIVTDWKAETGVATFASVPAKVTYLYATGLNNRQMDVTLTHDTPNDSPTSNKGSGGCDAGLGGVALLALAGLAATKKH